MRTKFHRITRAVLPRLSGWGPAQFVVEVLILVGAPVVLVALSTSLGLNEGYAVVLGFILFLGLFVRLVGVILWVAFKWTRRTLRKRRSAGTTLALLLMGACLAMPSAASSRTAQNGGGVNPPINSHNPTPWQLMNDCVPVDVWDRGLSPGTALTRVAYEFHVIVTECHTRDSVAYNPEYGLTMDDILQNSSPPYFKKVSIKIRWKKLSNLVKNPHVVAGAGMTRYYNCKIEGRLIRKGCLYVKRVGEVEHMPVPGVNPLSLTGHPEVAVTIDATGRVLGAWWNWNPL